MRIILVAVSTALFLVGCAPGSISADRTGAVSESPNVQRYEMFHPTAP
jgi:hypothetical protein